MDRREMGRMNWCCGCCSAFGSHARGAFEVNEALERLCIQILFMVGEDTPVLMYKNTMGIDLLCEK